MEDLQRLKEVLRRAALAHRAAEDVVVAVAVAADLAEVVAAEVGPAVLPSLEAL